MISRNVDCYRRIFLKGYGMWLRRKLLQKHYDKEAKKREYLVSDEVSTFVSRTKSAKYICLKALKYMSMMPLTVILL